MRESTLVANIMKAVRKAGCYVQKQHGSGYGRAGEPDLLILVPVGYQKYSVPLFCEVKVPGKKPTALQEYRMTQLEIAYAVVMWASSVSEVMDAIDDIQKGTL